MLQRFRSGTKSLKRSTWLASPCCRWRSSEGGNQVSSSPVYESTCCEIRLHTCKSWETSAFQWKVKAMREAGTRTQLIGNNLGALELSSVEFCFVPFFFLKRFQRRTRIGVNICWKTAIIRGAAHSNSETWRSWNESGAVCMVEYGRTVYFEVMYPG